MAGLQMVRRILEEEHLDTSSSRRWESLGSGHRVLEETAYCLLRQPLQPSCFRSPREGMGIDISFTPQDITYSYLQDVFALMHRLQRLVTVHGEAARSIDGDWTAYPLTVRPRPYPAGDP